MQAVHQHITITDPTSFASVVNISTQPTDINDYIYIYGSNRLVSKEAVPLLTAASQLGVNLVIAMMACMPGLMTERH